MEKASGCEFAATTQAWTSPSKEDHSKTQQISEHGTTGNRVVKSSGNQISNHQRATVERAMIVQLKLELMQQTDG